MSTTSTVDEIRVVLDNSNSSNSWSASLITCLITIVSGVIVFIFGQFLFSLWIQPLQKYKEIRQKIAYSLTYYAQYYSNVNTTSNKTPEYDRGSDEIRKLASELRGFSETISFIHFGIPKKEILYETSKELIGLSNSFYAPKDLEFDMVIHNLDRAKRIKDNLKMQDER